jgi:hypothetical protein
MSSRQFTLYNNKYNLVIFTIDRILCTTDVDKPFPLSSSKLLARLGTDHTPFLRDSSVDLAQKSYSYKFENWCLLRKDFRPLVEKILEC